MRPNHQKNRMRGRNRGGGGGGKGPNPLTRSYESNGPDVKVRGTAQNIAEKYLQLGRDAQATGDHVQAESYFQHAEHYFRLIAAAQEQFRLQNPGYRGFDQTEGEGDEGDDEQPSSSGPQVEPRGFASQPNVGDEETRSDEQPREFVPREGRGPRPPFRDRDQQRGFQPREQRDNREHRDNREPREHREPRDNRNFQPREDRFQRQPSPMPLETEQPGLPSFITAPVRTAPIETDHASSVSDAAPSADAGDFGAPIGIRRRGRPPRVRPDEDGVQGE
jgi:hypothetical protein